jgi:pilus assembly protein CpaC
VLRNSNVPVGYHAPHDRQSAGAGAVKIVMLALSLVLVAGSARAQQTAVSADVQPLHILVGKSVVINLQARLKRVLSSNPTVIDTTTTSPTQVVVSAKAVGTSSLVLWDEAGASRMLDVTVDLDVSSLRTALEKAYPHAAVQAQADGGRVILTGSVPDQHAADGVVKIAEAYSKEVVNSLASSFVPNHDQQILLEVKFAEVDRSKLEQFAINFISTGAGNTPGTISTQQFSPPAGSGGSPLTLSSIIGAPLRGTTSTFGLSDLLNVFLFRPDINLAVVIKALQQQTVLQILAQPNLLALSGQKASFLAGGEFPFPVIQGGANVGAVTIEFRPFGVKLDFTGWVNPDGVIRMHVAPEVSALDFTNALTLSGFTIPAISTRRAETEIELRDGQTFGIAGLMDDRVQALMSKIPGIGDIPILGQLFRSKSNQRTHTELMVLVTPRIADPVQTGAQAGHPPALAMPFLKSPDFDKDLPGHKELVPPPQKPAPGESTPR